MQINALCGPKCSERLVGRNGPRLGCMYCVVSVVKMAGKKVDTGCSSPPWSCASVPALVLRRKSVKHSVFLVRRNNLYFYSLQASIAAATAPPTRISNSEPRLPQPGTAAPDCKLASPVAVPVGLSVAPGVNTVMEVTVVTAPPGRVKVCVLVLEVGLAVGDGPAEVLLAFC